MRVLRRRRRKYKKLKDGYRYDKGENSGAS